MSIGAMHKGRPHGGGEGGFKNCPILRTNSTDRLRECVTKGGRGSRNVKNYRDVIYGWSLMKNLVDVMSPLAN